MSHLLRSKHGCWTCRLRKKKCDENQPRCAICESLSITCYGFGVKPDWMDGGEKERAVANSIKEIVKHTSRRKDMTQSGKRSGTAVKLAPKPVPNAVKDTTIALESMESATINNENERTEATNSSRLEDSSNLTSRSISSIPADESIFLMHFLDHVFPLQYPFYKPNIADGGRGWLLVALLRTKPLYHIALAISIHYHRKLSCGEINPMDIELAVLQEQHLEICIKVFTQVTGASCPSHALDIMFAILQHLFLELSTGDNAWQAHLRAASNMLQKGFDHEQSQHAQSDTYENLETSTQNDPSLSKNVPIMRALAVAQQVSQHRLVVCAIIWLDIIASITSGKTPELTKCHSYVILYDSRIDFENVIGCKNWVVFQIGRIASLHSEIIQAQHGMKGDCKTYKELAEDIEMKIQLGIAQEASKIFNKSDHDSCSQTPAAPEPTSLVTYIFACMASIYLHLVIQGFENLDIVEPSLSIVIEVLRSQVPVHLLHSLVLPLFVAGSVAKEGDKQFFRNIFSSPPFLDPSFNHRGNIIFILEEIWKRRQFSHAFFWNDCLGIIGNMLLI